MKFDFGLVALVLVLAREALNYIAPRTKSKADDKALAVVKKAEELLPAAKAIAGATQPAQPEAKPVAGFGVARDHREGK